MARRNPMRGVRTLALKKILRDAKRASRRRPLSLREALVASAAEATIQKRRKH